MPSQSFRFAILALSFALATSNVLATSKTALKPLLAQPDAIVLESSFSKPAPLAKGVWQQRQHTRWAIKDGILLGIPSTDEYQKSRGDHQGFEPRVSVPATPAECIAQFSVRFSGGEETPIAPFVEIGHHVARVKFSENGVFLIADGESVKVAEAKNFKYIPGKWYHILAELKSDEFVMQFTDGPTLYARHPSFAKPVKSGGNGLGITGPKGGTVEIDNLTLWSIKPKERSTWAKTRSAFPHFKPVILKKKKPAKATQ
ncbi:MAG: hypothetical protein HN763_03055 [Opitutales bacterium]|jgi:hypothetical protein|nr:hypothetical protein [Opitutales bacterium]MBT7865324.1 hypothetical protein [Opitutales bacterium]